MSPNDTEYEKTPLVGKIKYLREKSLKKKKINEEVVNTPVAYWIKEDRLIYEIGKEFNIILRTPGCSWALSDSGGCSMCGYIEDAYMGKVSTENILNQFDYAVSKKIEEIREDTSSYVLKIFNSGSFFDEREIPKEAAQKIYEKINEIPNIKEVIVESRPEFIKKKRIETLKEYLNEKYVEIGIGIESVNNHIRNVYLNKGIKYKTFLNAVKLLKSLEIGIKAYLLFKPPFLTEQAAIDDCKASIRNLIDLEVNSISINPMNIQKGSLVENLWFHRQYRPPWFYSLFECLQKSLNQSDLNKFRIISDPSGAGTQRGIHNCQDYECNNQMRDILRKFVLTQDLTVLKQSNQEWCPCRKIYELKRNFL
jgi:hypothetical protein